MKRVLVYILGGQGCQEAGQLDEAISQYEKGNEVLVVHCDRTVGGCRDNFCFNQRYCKNCIFFQQRHASKYFGKRNIKYVSIGQYLTEEIVRKAESFKPEYHNIRDIKNVTYAGVEIGYGLVSSYISATRNLNPDIDDKLRFCFDRVLKTEVRVIEMMDSVIKEYQPDLIVVHNGRHWTYKTVYGLAETHHIPFICTEFIHLPDGSEGKNYYINTYPHDKLANAQKYLTFWETTDDPQKKDVGESFFCNKRSAKYAGDTVYTASQKAGALPDNYEASKRNIVIFNSSEDEMFSVNSEIDKDMLFPSQIEGIRSIVNHYKDDENTHLYLRVHPNLKGVNYTYHTDLYKITAPNFTIVPAGSPISSYSMLDIADTVIVFGSTMGVEASYLGKRVVNLAFAFYDPLDIAYRPESIDELWHCLDPATPIIQNEENAIKMGYFYMSNKHEKLKYVPLITHRFKFFNRDQESHSYRTIFGSHKLFWLYFKILSILSRDNSSWL